MEKQNFNIKIYEACSEDVLRPVMMCVHFIGGFAYASDGCMVVKQSLDYHSVINPEVLDGKSIHRDNFKNIMQFEIAECTEEGVVCKDNDGRTAVFDYFDRKDMVLPNFEAILSLGKSEPVPFIGITPKLLDRVSKAMHSPSGALRVQFYGVDKPMRLDDPLIENQVAILSPAMLSESLFS
jgi:hypothetical protein